MTSKFTAAGSLHPAEEAPQLSIPWEKSQLMEISFALHPVHTATRAGDTETRQRHRILLPVVFNNSTFVKMTLLLSFVFKVLQMIFLFL